MVLLLTGCAGGDTDTDVDQSFRGSYCLICANVEVESDVKTHETRNEMDKPEKKE